MAIGVHIVHVGLIPVNELGAVVNKMSATIQQMITSSSEHRVMESASVPNSAGNPTVDNYITAEADDGYVVYHLDQYTIVTYAIADLV